MGNSLEKRIVKDILLTLPAFVFVLSILLVRVHLFSMPMTDIYWSEATDTSTMSDIFSYWKAVTIIGAACLAALFLIIGYFSNSIRFKKSFLYIPIFIYVVFVLISFFASDYKYFALRGMSEHFEGTIVLLAYMVMVLFLANMVDSDRRIKYVIYCALGVACLLGILGVTQAIGQDFFSTTTGQKMMSPNYTLDNGMKMWDMIDIMADSGQSVFGFSFSEGEVYQTVYNINYVPFYLSLLIPISAVLFIYFATNGSRKKGVSIVLLALYGLLLYNFFAANSASGYCGLLAIFIAALIIFHKELRRWVKPIICLIVVSAMVLGVLSDRWIPEIKNQFAQSLNFILTPVYADDLPADIITEYENAPGSKYIVIDYIDSTSNPLRFGINGAELKVFRDVNNASYAFMDGDNNQLYIREVPNQYGFYEILDPRFHDYVRLALSNVNENSYVVVATEGTRWPFRFNGESFVYLNPVGKEVPIGPVKHAQLFDYAFGSQRGLIYDTVIPMLDEYILIGAGADAFTFVYPQNDYVTLHNQFWGYKMTRVTDKAHNLFLQYWVNTGLLSLIAWLALVGYYLLNAIKLFHKQGFVKFSDFVNGGIFCGIVGFLFIALFNDGSVNTMPMFYTMLGTGLAINMKDRWMSESDTSGKKQASMPEI